MNGKAVFYKGRNAQAMSVCVGDTWRWGFWVDLIPVPSLDPNSPQKKRSAVCLHTVSKEKKRKEKKDYHHVHCRFAEIRRNQQWRRADVGISTPITSELGWERLCDLSDRALKWLSIHRAATRNLNEPSRLFFLIFHPDNHKHTRVWMSSSVLSSTRLIAFSVDRHRWQIRDIHIYRDHFCCRPAHM